MSEPSLRDTIIREALAEFYPSGGAPDEAIRDDVTRVVDAALATLREHVEAMRAEDDPRGEFVHHEFDAVLALLAEREGE